MNNLRQLDPHNIFVKLARQIGINFLISQIIELRLGKVCI